MFKRVLLVFISSLMVVLLVGCNKTKYTYYKPTKEFYINDYAKVFLRFAKWDIYTNGKSLYETSIEDDKVPKTIEGAQIVVLTAKENDDPLFSNIIFNEWKIGKNDMGILIILLFDDADNLVSVTVELGLMMMTYLSMIEVDEMLDDYLFNSYWDGDFEIGLLVLYHELIGFVYTEIYDYNSYTYDLDYLIDNQYETYFSLPSEERGILSLMDNHFWLFILIFLFFPSLLGLLGFMNFSKRSKGGGGKSLGYFFKKRK